MGARGHLHRYRTPFRNRLTSQFPSFITKFFTTNDTRIDKFNGYHVRILTVFFPESSSTPVPKMRGRPMGSAPKKFRGDQYSSSTPQISASQSSLESTTRKRKQATLCISKRGYCSQFVNPKPSKRRDVFFKTPEGTTTAKRASKPTGMRILDIGILADAMQKLKCTSCSSALSLFESDFDQGWQTTYSIKCLSCHLLLVEFPSSKPMDVPLQTTYVNVPLPLRGLNEVTMRSVLAVHSTGFSWRDLHKFATIFDMLPPLGEMPPRYLNKFVSVVQFASQTSMNAAAAELHSRSDAVPSPVTSCINIAVSFDSSWKTRGFYSNLSFGISHR